MYSYFQFVNQKFIIEKYNLSNFGAKFQTQICLSHISCCISQAYFHYGNACAFIDTGRIYYGISGDPESHLPYNFLDLGYGNHLSTIKEL